MTETIRYSEELWHFHFFSVSITIWLSAWILPTQTKYYTTIKLVSQEISWRTIFSLFKWQKCNRCGGWCGGWWYLKKALIVLAVIYALKKMYVSNVSNHTINWFKLFKSLFRNNQYLVSWENQFLSISCSIS